MPRVLKKWLVEVVLLSLYKYIFETSFLSRYMMVFGYLFNGVTYKWNVDKWLFGNIAFIVLLMLLFNNRPSRNGIYNAVLRFLFGTCVIPMLSVYSFFEGIDAINIIYPLIFFFILICWLKHYGCREEARESILVSLPYIKNVDMFMLIASGSIAVLIWAISGFPVALNLDIAYERRMALRMDALPTVLNYLFMFIGGTVFPYLFAKGLSRKKYVLVVLSVVFGILMYFVNGMKTWLLLYPVAIGIMLLNKLSEDREERLDYIIDLAFLVIPLICVGIYDTFGSLDFMSQFARVTVIPNNIGFKSIDFFKDNELLYLRESILRGFWPSPYEGGSDFYINYGANSTLTSSRANNGLWGDAFRNFGTFGMFIYPFAIGSVFHVVELNVREEGFGLRLFILFLILWSSINTSFFTWLLTGGVIIIVIMSKIDSTNKTAKHMIGSNRNE